MLVLMVIAVSVVVVASISATVFITSAMNTATNMIITNYSRACDKRVSDLELAHTNRHLAASEREEIMRGEIQSLTQALVRVKNGEVPIVYPSRGALEPSPGWFDGKPQLVTPREEGRG